MERAGPHLHVVGLVEHAAFGRPVGVEGQNHVLEQHGLKAVGRPRAKRAASIAAPPRPAEFAGRSRRAGGGAGQPPRARKQGFELRNARFGRYRPGLGRIGPRLGGPPCGVLLQGVEDALARLLIEEVHFLALHAEVETQRLAAKQHGPVQVLHHRLRLVRIAHEPATLELQPQVLPGRVVLPVFAHPEPLVELCLAPFVLAPCAPRCHLHHEGGDRAFLPRLVDKALLLRDAERHEHVRRYPGTRIAFLVVDEEIRGHVDVRAVPEMEGEGGERVVDRAELPVVPPPSACRHHSDTRWRRSLEHADSSAGSSLQRAGVARTRGASDGTMPVTAPQAAAALRCMGAACRRAVRFKSGDRFDVCRISPRGGRALH